MEHMSCFFQTPGGHKEFAAAIALVGIQILSAAQFFTPASPVFQPPSRSVKNSGGGCSWLVDNGWSAGPQFFTLTPLGAAIHVGSAMCPLTFVVGSLARDQGLAPTSSYQACGVSCPAPKRGGNGQWPAPCGFLTVSPALMRGITVSTSAIGQARPNKAMHRSA